MPPRWRMAPLAGARAAPSCDSTQQATCHAAGTILAERSSLTRTCIQHCRWIVSLSSTHPTSGAASSRALHPATTATRSRSRPALSGTTAPRRGQHTWTVQWTRTHVCVFRESAPPYHPFWVRASEVRRRIRIIAAPARRRAHSKSAAWSRWRAGAREAVAVPAKIAESALRVVFRACKNSQSSEPR
jgi:hypothetical protein